MPGKDFASFHIIASHSDSPTFKIKDNPEQQVKGKYVQLNTEKYGGMIFSTWFDRPLSVAGRALVKTDKGVETKLVNIDRDLVVIPNLAIHLDRTANDGMKYNPQVNLLPRRSTCCLCTATPLPRTPLTSWLPRPAVSRRRTCSPPTCSSTTA